MFGWLSQAKRNRDSYSQEYVDSFRNAINSAFELGQEYASERP
jgi:hypothetical protein